MISEIREHLAADMLFAAAQEVFTSMLSAQLTRENSKNESVAPFDGVMSFVGLTGEWSGTGLLICDSGVACDLASRLLMANCECITDEVLDAVGEVTNMVIGSLKNWLEGHMGAMKMSTPTVVYGKNISSRSSRNDLRTSARCSYNAGQITFTVCLAKV
jgi:chemotaxis protein CheX